MNGKEHGYDACAAWHELLSDEILLNRKCPGRDRAKLPDRLPFECTLKALNLLSNVLRQHQPFVSRWKQE